MGSQSTPSSQDRTQRPEAQGRAMPGARVGQDPWSVLGVSPEALPNWTRRGTSREAPEQGILPSGFGPARWGTVVDWLNDSGLGVTLVMGRCALTTKWQTGFNGVRHNPNGTAMQLLGSVRLDPGDSVLAEFELWPHVEPLANPTSPVIVTRVAR